MGRETVYRRLQKYRVMIGLALFALFAKVLVSIVSEYRSYFPADFDSAFLTGRASYFFGTYGAAFYTHIISGPIAIVIGFVLMMIGRWPRWAKTHRLLGRLQMLIVIGVLVPSGLVMSTHAYSGPIAGWGFALHSLAIGGCAVMAICTALSRNFTAHRQWATRCFLLLCAPLLLRIVSGATIVTQFESHLTYRLSAWLSWLAPLLVYEIGWRIRRYEKAKRCLADFQLRPERGSNELKQAVSK